MKSGIINVLKPPGMTSHDVVSFIRRTYSQKRVGHAGTLDPAAAGVLPVFIGPATRLIEYTADADKAYRAEITFGYATDSGDDTGEVISRADEAYTPDYDRLDAVLKTFLGEIDQIPPMHSAIKIGGKKLYDLAREGVTIEREPRRITIKNIELIAISGSTAIFDVTCSKGTYIRSLCSDIGQKICCPAVMSFLVRTRVGVFDLNDAKTLEEIAANKEAAVLPVDYAIRHLPEAILPNQQATAFKNGQIVLLNHADCQALFRVYDQSGAFIGIGDNSADSSRLAPVKVLS